MMNKPHRSRLATRMAAAALVAGVATLTGCMVVPAEDHYYGDRGDEQGPMVAVAPPPPYVEYAGPPPATGYIWLGGYWGWDRGRHVWHNGRWAAPRPGYRWAPHTWAPHTWAREGRNWRAREGRWRRH